MFFSVTPLLSMAAPSQADKSPVEIAVIVSDSHRNDPLSNYISAQYSELPEEIQLHSSTGSPVPHKHSCHSTLPSSGHVLSLAWKKSPPRLCLLRTSHLSHSQKPTPLLQQLPRSLAVRTDKTSKPYTVILDPCLYCPLNCPTAMTTVPSTY